MSRQLLTKAFKENLTPGEKLVFVDLAWRSNEDGECFALLESLMESSSLSKRGVQDNLAKLEARKLVIRNQRGGRSSTFKIYPQQADSALGANSASADSAPQQADSAPQQADSAPQQADSAPISTTYPLPNHYLSTNTPLPPAAPAAKKPKPQAAKGSAAAAVIDLPDCITPKIWQQVIAHRKTKKQPVTELALQSVADHLAKLHTAGNDLQEVVSATIRANYPDFYPTRKPPAQLAVVNGKAPYAPVNHATGGDHATVSRF